MKTLKADPGARRLLESLRDLGYECNTAIADIVDNSIAARSSEVYVDILPRSGSRPAAIMIADNGNGMGRKELHEAMRFGAYQKYSEDDLGKFGLGLKTASLSQCKVLTVSSKEKSSRGVRSRRQCMRWDVEHVYKSDTWNLLEPTIEELEPWEGEILLHKATIDNGTVVLWSDLDEGLSLLSADDVRDRERFLAQIISDTRKHLRMVFHRFIQGSVTGHRKLQIYVCGELLEPWDPFFREEKTRDLDILKLSLDGSAVVVSPFILPREDEFSSPGAWKDASGPLNWNQQQGFYFYRNNRLLQAGGWSHMRAPDEHTKLLRVAVDFSSRLDRNFSINITKMRARIPAELRSKISQELGSWSGVARRRYDGRKAKAITPPSKTFVSTPTQSPAKNVEVVAPSVTVGPVVFFQGDKAAGPIVVTKNKKTSQFEMVIPRKHMLMPIFETKNNYDDEIKRLCLATFAILEAVYLKKIPTKAIPMDALRKVYKRNL
jgi:hypothetical protein